MDSSNRATRWVYSPDKMGREDGRGENWESKAPSTPATMSKKQATLLKQRSTLSKQHSTLLPQRATMSNVYRKISSFRQSRNKLDMFNLFRLCRKDEISFDIVAKNGNNVEATFDTVERIVRLVAFDNVASTLLLVWTGPKGNCGKIERRIGGISGPYR